MESIDVNMVENSKEKSVDSLQRPCTLNVSPAAVQSTDEMPPKVASSDCHDSALDDNNASLASKQLAAGFLQILEPPVEKVRGQLRELICKQNKIYVDLSAEKFKLDNAEIAQLQDMMINIKVYREKLLKIKKQMQSIYQRTKSLKKRAQNVEACKQKELQRKLQKQQQEEALIGK